MGILPAAFVVLAAFAAAAARPRPVSPALVGVLAVLPAAVVAGAGVATTTTRIDQGLTPLVGAGTLAVGAAALALAGQRPERGGVAARMAGWLLALGLASLPKIYPVVLGAGEGLFGETSDKKSMRLVDTRTVDGSVAYLTYERVRDS